MPLPEPLSRLPVLFHLLLHLLQVPVHQGGSSLQLTLQGSSHACARQQPRAAPQLLEHLQRLAAGARSSRCCCWAAVAADSSGEAGQDHRACRKDGGSRMRSVRQHRPGGPPRCSAPAASLHQLVHTGHRTTAAAAAPAAARPPKSSLSRPLICCSTGAILRGCSSSAACHCGALNSLTCSALTSASGANSAWQLAAAPPPSPSSLASSSPVSRRLYTCALGGAKAGDHRGCGS